MATLKGEFSVTKKTIAQEMERVLGRSVEVREWSVWVDGYAYIKFSGSTVGSSTVNEEYPGSVGSDSRAAAARVAMQRIKDMGLLS